VFWMLILVAAVVSGFVCGALLCSLWCVSMLVVVRFYVGMRGVSDMVTLRFCWFLGVVVLVLGRFRILGRILRSLECGFGILDR